MHCRRSGRARAPCTHRLGRLRRGRPHRPELRLGPPFEEETGCKVEREDRQHVRRDGAVDAAPASTTVCRHRATQAAPHRCRSRSHRSTPSSCPTTPTSRLPEGHSRTTRGRPDLRHPARLGCQLLDVQHRRRQGRRPIHGAWCSTPTRRTRARSRPTTRRSTSPTPRSAMPCAEIAQAAPETRRQAAPHPCCRQSVRRSPPPPARDARRTRAHRLRSL